MMAKLNEAMQMQLDMMNSSKAASSSKQHISFSTVPGSSFGLAANLMDGQKIGQPSAS